MSAQTSDERRSTVTIIEFFAQKANAGSVRVLF
jgi:hypothetical protein